MKDTTIHSLVIARTLLERSEPLCASDDRYLASAGLTIMVFGTTPEYERDFGVESGG
jgi:hypothetical protein